MQRGPGMAWPSGAIGFAPVMVGTSVLSPMRASTETSAYLTGRYALLARPHPALHVARDRRVRQALQRRDRRHARRMRRGGYVVALGWRPIGATEQPWELPGR